MGCGNSKSSEQEVTATRAVTSSRVTGEHEHSENPLVAVGPTASGSKTSNQDPDETEIIPAGEEDNLEVVSISSDDNLEPHTTIPKQFVGGGFVGGAPSQWRRVQKLAWTVLLAARKFKAPVKRLNNAASNTDTPATWRRVQVGTLSNDAKAALIITESPAAAPGAREVTVKFHYAGINATDSLFCGGLVPLPVPFDVGLEGLGVVVAVGADAAERFKVDAAVLVTGFGSGWAEYKNISIDTGIFEVPSIDPKYLTLPISALSAAITVGEQSEAKEGDVAVVTAASGGFGQFAVQFLKARGCTVVGTCSTSEKCDFLKSIGCDRPVNYKKENLGEVLQAEYPKGVNIVYELVGGAIFEECLSNLAYFGRFIVIGAVSGYKEGKGMEAGDSIHSEVVHGKSCSVKGFMQPHWAHKMPQYIGDVLPKIASGEIKCHIDEAKTFRGLEQIPDAVVHQLSGKSFGKVVVEIQ